MELTKKQEEGVKIAVERYNSGERITVIAGYAGSGKSTLVQVIVEALDLDPKDVCYATFTGKAAEVLRKKGCPNACTLHKLVYHNKPLPDGTFIRCRKTSLPYKICVVDEISMVPNDIFQDLLRTGIHIIALGDPGQLPPINPKQNNRLLDYPHIFLDEIVRQAKDSEIIWLSMQARYGKDIPYCRGKEIQVVPYSELNTGLLQWGDITLCATNATRTRINNQIRALQGFGAEPQEGDRVICLKNYDIVNSDDEPITNGTIGTITDLHLETIPKNGRFKPPIPEYQNLYCHFTPDGGTPFFGLPIDPKMLISNTKTLTPNQEYRLRGSSDKAKLPLEFAYGYAITTHKAQGSEWNKILILEEKFPTVPLDHKRWLYTAITRSVEKLVLVR